MPYPFNIDIVALRQTILGNALRILMKPIADALDDAVTDILVRLNWSRGILTYVVEVNDREGFWQLSEACTVLATKRKGIASARAMCRMAAAEFVALCYPGPVSISTTSRTITLDRHRCTVTKRAAARRQAGSESTARVRIDRDQANAFADRLRMLIVRPGVTVNLDIDGQVTTIGPRSTLRQIEATLPAVVEDEEGPPRPTKRLTKVGLYQVSPGETPMLYELGIPVVGHPGPWHIDIRQEIPLASSRAAVTAACLRAVHAAALDAGADVLTRDQANARWVTNALVGVKQETLQTVLRLRHGANAVIYDPSAPLANARAREAGYNLVFGGAFSREVWARIRNHGLLRPAGQCAALRGEVLPDADRGAAIPPNG